jgi:Mlc titration factor MtfA (ptsG expression regulator)
MRSFRVWRRRRILERRPLDDALWRRATGDLPILHRLNADEVARLRELVTVFLHEKSFYGSHGLVVDDYMRVVVAAQACLPILNLGIDYYRGWYSIALYPGGFVAEREFEDDDGIVHTGYEELDGESAEGGPIALAWDEAQPQPDGSPYNVVIHEFAHKLDELTGVPNGLPPLHPDMSVKTWAAVMSAAFEDFSAAADTDPALDDYAATDPAEFFAVMSELFFTVPHELHEDQPTVYEQLTAFYRQDPSGVG